MPQRDIVVIGASAGGVEALQKLTAQFPADLPASVFVVLHMPPRTRSFLPEILRRCGALPAVHPEDGAAIEPGTIYVAPPDHHLVIERDHVHLSLGPKEQHHRPCINVTLRSAALSYGERVIGAILTGELDDGTAGLWEVKRRGGITLVQNPEDADFPSMPLSALRDVEVDYTVSLPEMGSLLGRLIVENEGIEKGEKLKGETISDAKGNDMEPQLTDMTCPDCRGTIWECQRGNGKEYRCRVGHTFSPRSMLSEHYAAQEKALYGAMVMIEEGAALTLRLAGQFQGEFGERLREEARERESQARALRKVLREHRSFSLD